MCYPGRGAGSFLPLKQLPPDKKLLTNAAFGSGSLQRMCRGRCCLCVFPPTSRKDLKSLIRRAEPGLDRDGKKKKKKRNGLLEAAQSPEGQRYTIIKTALLPPWRVWPPMSLVFLSHSIGKVSGWAGLWCLSTWSQADAVSGEHRTIQR